MTPTLFGRWQTRGAMLATLGVLVTLLLFRSLEHPGPFVILASVFVFGVVWDVVWIGLQKFRWERDWPAVFQVGSGVVEGGWLFFVLASVGLPLVPAGSVDAGTFVVHYGLVWLLIFIWLQGPMRALLPRWRYHGGRLI